MREKERTEVVLQFVVRHGVGEGWVVQLESCGHEAGKGRAWEASPGSAAVLFQMCVGTSRADPPSSSHPPCAFVDCSEWSMNGP